MYRDNLFTIHLSAHSLTCFDYNATAVLSQTRFLRGYVEFRL
jgi:hypothetical protein